MTSAVLAPTIPALLGIDDGHADDWRRHGLLTLIEHDNTQNDANHIHSVRHDLERNWGRDLLRDHYAHGHAHG